MTTILVHRVGHRYSYNPALVPVADEYEFVRGEGWNVGWDSLPGGGLSGLPHNHGWETHVAVNDLVARGGEVGEAVARWYRRIWPSGQGSTLIGETAQRTIWPSTPASTLRGAWSAVHDLLQEEWPNTSWGEGGGQLIPAEDNPRRPAQLGPYYCLTGPRGLVHLTITVYGHGYRVAVDQSPRTGVAVTFCDDVKAVLDVVRAAPDVNVFPPRSLPGELCVE